jgi:aldehyde:ferredoxin oxidoreductase
VGRDDDMLPQCFYTVPLERAYGNHECLTPGKDGEVISKKGTVVDRAAFESMKDEYYQIREWDVTTGLPIVSKLKETGLSDIISDLARKRLVI